MECPKNISVGLINPLMDIPISFFFSCSQCPMECFRKPILNQRFVLQWTFHGTCDILGRKIQIFAWTSLKKYSIFTEPGLYKKCSLQTIQEHSPFWTRHCHKTKFPPWICP